MQRYCKDKIYVNLRQNSTDLNKGNEMKESSDAKKKNHKIRPRLQTSVHLPCTRKAVCPSISMF